MDSFEAIEGVSIVICCYNSAPRLPETLRHISLQKVSPHIPWEVIVVNNASKDNTEGVARQIWTATGCNVPFQVVNENTPGLSYAREKGFKTAKYDFVLFCDDDNWLNNDYVETGYIILQSNQDIGALGGHGEAVCEISPPPWFRSIGSMVFATAPRALHSGEINSPSPMVYGAGAFIRRSYFLHLQAQGFKSRLTDRKGKEISSGGDDEICYALCLAGYKIWYDERLYFRHFIPQERLNREYVKRFFHGSAKATIVLEPFSEVLKNTYNSQNDIKRFTSIKKSIIFLLWEGLPYLKKELKMRIFKSSRSSLPKRLEFYRKLMMAKHWLMDYKEYDKNLFIFYSLKIRLLNAKRLRNE